MRTHHPSSYLMVRPARFEFNAQTAGDNHYQHKDPNADVVAETALDEFDAMVEQLSARDIDLTVVQDTPEPPTPDSIFPNNWASYHPDGTVILYPMQARNRRAETDKNVLATIADSFQITDTMDLRTQAIHNHFLEGTGSIVFDHDNLKAYAGYSDRTEAKLFETVCHILQYEAVGFHTADENDNEIYHTNVMMSVGDTYAVVCLDALRHNLHEQQTLIRSLKETGKDIIPISLEQVRSFAGNVLQVFSRQGDPYTLMSTEALWSFSSKQIGLIDERAPVLPISIPTIEANGGGGVRCMVAEVYLPLK